MKIVAISVVRNEADILESFVRHCLRFADEMTVVDHRSEDGSRGLLELLRAEGLPLTVRHDDGLPQRQSMHMTAMMREAFSSGADLVLPLDADEFLVADGGDVRAALHSLPTGRMFLLPWKTYVPDDDVPGYDAAWTMRMRRERETPAYCKVALGRTGTHERLIIAQGSHAIEGEDDSCIPAAGLSLAHFPVRSARQLRCKILRGWESHDARDDKRDDEATHWKRLHERCIRADPILADELRRLALTYASQDGDTCETLVDDPAIPGIVLRHSPTLAQP